MTTDTGSTDPVRIAFVCGQNADRSQMSSAFADRKRERRGLEDRVEILLAGRTRPITSVMKCST